jgi:hypothetical protein
MSDDHRSPKAQDELRDALQHFKNAAQILLDKATHDPKIKRAAAEAERVIGTLGDRAERVTTDSVRTAATEAERVIEKLSHSAEPVAQRLGSEIGKLFRKVSDALDREDDSK